MRIAFVIGILIGLALGLAYAWLIAPVEFTTADPVHVEPRYKDVWIVMAAEAYLTGGDWDRTRARLNGLNDPDLEQTVAALFDRYNGDGPNDAARALARLADQLGETTAPMSVYLTTPFVTPTLRPSPAIATRTPAPTEVVSTPTESFPTLTPTATPVPEFVVAGRDNECVSGAPQIRVTVQDLEGNGLPGVDVWITWDGGADRFVTGLKPEFGSGYGDFDMQPDVSYRVGAGTQSALALASNLRATPCTTPAGVAGRLSWTIVLQPLVP